MAEIITARYSSPETLTNVRDDLLATGIPLEKIRVHEGKVQVQVLTAGAADPEITEILKRHQPTELMAEQTSA